MKADSRRVLVVDDNRDAADSTADLLHLVGFDTLACYDGPGALHAVAEFRPGLCLLDFHMPGMHGDVLAARLRDRLAGRPVVLVALTAMDGGEALRRIEAAFDLRLTKPADPVALVTVVRDKYPAGG